jgi:putative redox protein
MSTERFEFTGSDGQRLAGLIDRPDAASSSAVALFAHCFTCTKNSVAAARVARALTARGVAVLRFDFTGLGASEGEFGASGFSGNVRDIEAAGGALAERVGAPSLLIGHSLGGAAVLAAALAMPSVKAVATIGAPYDVAHVTHLFSAGLERLMRDGEADVDIGGRPFRLRRSFVEDLQQQEQGARIRALRRALLVMHATRDDTVGIDNAASIFQAAVHPKSFVSLHDADHLLTRSEDAEYVAAVVAAWSSRYLAHPNLP